MTSYYIRTDTTFVIEVMVVVRVVLVYLTLGYKNINIALNALIILSAYKVQGEFSRFAKDDISLNESLIKR